MLFRATFHGSPFDWAALFHVLVVQTAFSYSKPFTITIAIKLNWYWIYFGIFYFCFCAPFQYVWKQCSYLKKRYSVKQTPSLFRNWCQKEAFVTRYEDSGNWQPHKPCTEIWHLWSAEILSENSNSDLRIRYCWRFLPRSFGLYLYVIYGLRKSIHSCRNLSRRA